MASFAPIRGTRAQIQATPIVDGQFLIETDQGVDNMIYIDEGSTRTIVGGNTISGVLPELYIYSETGSVVTVEDAGGNVIPTSQVGTDHWTCELPDYGVYTITSVLSGETTTQSIDVNDCMIYTIDASHFHVNIVVTYPSGVGASCQISGGGETYSAPALNPPNTSYKFVVHGKNTTYTITTTVDGATKTTTVTSGTTIDQTYEVTMSYGQINLTVEIPPITGDITCTDGITTIIKPASANMVFYVPNTGTWDISGSDGSITYSTSAIVTSLSTPVSAGLNTGLDLASWITAGSTTEYPLNPSSYANFAALEADEAAIRQLMLVHDSVDYLATAPAGDNLMQNVINSDICAKWINLSDYALDTLGANSDIASEMDSADKYGYGEWGIVDATTTPPTWGALGNVPIMTANNAPYGNAIADGEMDSVRAKYKVFDGNSTSYWAVSSTAFPHWIGYESVAPICVRGVSFTPDYDGDASNPQSRIKTYKVQGSNTGDTNDWHDIYSGVAPDVMKVEQKATFSNDDFYLFHRLYVIDRYGTSNPNYCSLYDLQFYGRELSPLVPTMTADDKPKGVASAKSVYNDSASYKAYKAFDGDDSTYWMSSNGEADGAAYVEYRFGEKVKPMMYKVKAGLTGGTASQNSIKIESSDDNFTSDITDLAGTLTFALEATKIGAISGASAKKDFRVRTLASNYVNGASVVHTFQIFGSDYSEKEFATGSMAKWIYDHGVELVSLDQAYQYYSANTGHACDMNSNEIYMLSTQNSSTEYVAGVITANAIDLTSYNNLFVKMFQCNPVRTDGVYPYVYVCTAKSSYNSHTAGQMELSPTPNPQALDISSFSQSEYIAVDCNNGRRASITEIWLE